MSAFWGVKMCLQSSKAAPVKDLGPKPNDKLTHHLQTQMTRALAVTSFPEEGSVKEA